MFHFMQAIAQPLSTYSFKSKSLPLPVQSLRGASPTHLFCNQQALLILQNDGYEKEARLFNYFLSSLNDGVTWADKGFKSLYHHYDAETKTGKWHWTSAATLCNTYTDKAFSLWKKQEHTKAMFYLGAATHLVQDMCVPHHARCIVLDGHLDYENWVEVNRYSYGVDDLGLYLNHQSPVEWIHTNASFSRNYFFYVQENSTQENYHIATKVLLPRAQRSTSGFWHYFYYKINGV